MSDPAELRPVVASGRRATTEASCTSALGAVAVRLAATAAEVEHARAALVAAEADGEVLGRSAVAAGDGSDVRPHHDQEARGGPKPHMT